MASVDTNKRQVTEAARALIGMAVVERVFHFLDGPADVLRAATASRRWHELATSDSVWRLKARREGMVEKAGVFEVALPAAAAAAAAVVGGGVSSSSAATGAKKDELAGVGLSFYSQIYVLKVPIAHALPSRPPCRPPTLFSHAGHLHRRTHTTAGPLALVRSVGVQDEGRGLLSVHVRRSSPPRRHPNGRGGVVRGL